MILVTGRVCGKIEFFRMLQVVRSVSFICFIISMIVHSSRKHIEQNSCSWVCCCHFYVFLSTFISHAAERIWNHRQGSAIWKEPISTPLQNEDFWAWWGCSQIKILVLCCQVEENQEVTWRSRFLQTGLHCVNNIIEAIAALYSDYFIWESLSHITYLEYSIWHLYTYACH